MVTLLNVPERRIAAGRLPAPPITKLSSLSLPLAIEVPTAWLKAPNKVNDLGPKLLNA
jgi:hypothetical protein